MDIWRYYHLIHKDHFLCNPMSKEKFLKLCQRLRLKKGSRALEIACGKGEFMLTLAKMYDISGVGVDISPYCVEECTRKKDQRCPDSDILFVQGDGASYEPDKDENIDITMCVGADWIFKGTKRTLETLMKWTRPGGTIVLGDKYWHHPPSNEYIKATDLSPEDGWKGFKDNITIGEEEGLKCVFSIESNLDDWDEYETLTWWAVYDHIMNNPDDPDNDDLSTRLKNDKENYLRYERGVMGWAFYVFKM